MKPQYHVIFCVLFQIVEKIKTRIKIKLRQTILGYKVAFFLFFQILLEDVLGFRTIYEGQEPSRNKVVLPARRSPNCKPFKEPRNRFPVCGPVRQPINLNRFLCSLTLPQLSQAGGGLTHFECKLLKLLLLSEP